MDAQGPSTSEASLLSARLSQLEHLQKNVLDHPYSIPLRVQLAKAYQSLGYPDLAAGDAYRALLLIDELVQEGEYHEEVAEAAQIEITSEREHIKLTQSLSNVNLTDHSKCRCTAESLVDQQIGKEDLLIWATTCWSNTAYATLVACLIDCGCLRSAYNYNSRALKAFPDSAIFQSLKDALTGKLHSYFKTKSIDPEHAEVEDYPDKGRVRRELYPWNSHEPDRYSSETLQFLNDEMSIVAPKLEVRVTCLPDLSPNNNSDGETKSDSPIFVKQLGIFAKEDLAPGDLVLQEKSILSATGRLQEFFCDACSASLPQLNGSAGDSSDENVPIACEDCDEVYFCSPECHELASSNYHPAICGASMDFAGVPAKERPDTLYTLLLVRALAMAETRDMHPLDLKEVKFIWGDYHGIELNNTWRSDADGQRPDPFCSIPQTLPFSFVANIQTPLHMLEKMDVNIFEQSHRYDFWIFNTLYAKFRGTASARQGPDGRPDVSAVHPLWCLANHSCDPNVRWEWQGSMRLWVREKSVEWTGRPESEKPGIQKDEEIMSHYCDVELPVKERREWAAGALGGICMCRRCIWEEAEEQRQHDTI
jgi:hypothetical protein